MSAWEAVDETPAPRVDAPDLGDWEVTATRGSSGFMAKLSPALYRLLLEYGDQVSWLHNPDRELIAMQSDLEDGRHTVCTDGRVSMGWSLSGLYGQDMLGRRCRAAFQADRDGVRVVIWPRDHSVESEVPDGDQQELPL